MKRYFKGFWVSPFGACIGIAGDDSVQIGSEFIALHGMIVDAEAGRGNGVCQGCMV